MALVFISLALTAMVASLVLLAAALVLIPLGCEEFFRSFARLVADLWFTCAAAVLEICCGTRVLAQTTYARDSDRTVVVICNHKSDVDWAFLWCLATRLRRSHDLCIVLNESVKRYPFFGWAMQAFLFVFLSGSTKERHLAEMHVALRYLRRRSAFMLVFSDGSDPSPSNAEKSREIGASMAPPVGWHGLLFPYAARTAAAVSALKPDALYDLTISYETPDQQPPSVLKVWLKGIYPTAFRVVGERIDASKLPRSQEAWKTWLSARFAQKQQGNVAALPVAVNEPPMRRKYLVAMCGWSIVVAAFCAGLFYCSGIRAAAAVGCMLWIVVTTVFGGFNGILISRALVHADF